MDPVVEVGADHAPPEPTQVIDPVCGMTVDPASAPATLTQAGTTNYFCSTGCRGDGPQIEDNGAVVIR